MADKVNTDIDGSTEAGSLAAFAEKNGLKLVLRGAQCGRLMLGDQELVVARGLGCAQRLRAWLEGWVQSQASHTPSMVSGSVMVTVDSRQFYIKYHWVVPSTLVPQLSQELNQMVEEHVPDEIRKGATRGLMCSLETDGGGISEVHGWWCAGFEEERLAAAERAKWQAQDDAHMAYLQSLTTACKSINEHYDAAVKSGEKCFLSLAGEAPKRIVGHAVESYVWLSIPVSDGGRRFRLKVGSKYVGGIGDGVYNLESSKGDRTAIVIPTYP